MEHDSRWCALFMNDGVFWVMNDGVLWSWTMCFGNERRYLVGKEYRVLVSGDVMPYMFTV